MLALRHVCAAMLLVEMLAATFMMFSCLTPSCLPNMIFAALRPMFDTTYTFAASMSIYAFYYSADAY